jgi:transposase-like protein
LAIHGARHYLWRAVDQEGNILDMLVQRRRDKQAAKRVFRKRLKGLTYAPWRIVTDQLGGHGAAKGEILPSVEHRPRRYLNTRVEHSHQPTCQRERRMQRFKSPDTPNASSPPMALSRPTFAHGATGSRPPRPVRKCGSDSGSGGRSQAWPWPHKG